MSSDSGLDYVFNSFLCLKKFKQSAMGLLVLGTIVSFCYDVLFCWLKSSDQCYRVVDLDFVQDATTFSFSLTAFLLVSIAVVHSADRQIYNIDNGDGGFSGGEGSDSPDRGPPSYSGSIDVDLEHRLIPFEIDEDEERLIRIPQIVQNVEGTIEFEPSFPNNDGDDPNNTSNGEDDNSERRTPSQNFEKDLKSALSYSISASLLGVLLTGLIPLPIDEAMIGHLANQIPFTILTHAFTLIFLGMVWTSVGLLDVLDKT